MSHFTKTMCLLALSAAVLALAVSARATPLYEYNYTSGSLANTGSASDGLLAPAGAGPVFVASKTDSNGVTFTDLYDFNSTVSNHHFSKIANQTLAAFTVSLWAWTDSAAPSIYSSVFMNDSIQINIEGGDYRLRGAANRAFGAKLNDTWQHIAMTWDGTDLRLYLDGELKNTAAGDNNSDGFNEIGIGTNRARDANGRFRGMIDELFIDTDALTTPQIKAIYDAHVPEPSSIAISTIGLLTLLSRRRRRRRSESEKTTI